MVPFLPPGVVSLPGRRPQIGTLSLVPGISQFDEIIIKRSGNEFRVMDPMRSKLAAAIVKGVKDPGIRPGDVVLYLGASHGYTPSFVSDIVGAKGFVFALDFAPRVVRDLVFVSKERPNMAPILADASHPEAFCARISEVDWLYQDVAQKNQVEIFLKNVSWFLKDGGFACLALKARSVDVSKNPRQMYAKATQELEKHVEIIDAVELDPLQKGHCFFVVKKV